VASALADSGAGDVALLASLAEVAMTTKMRDTLEVVRRGGLRRVHDDGPGRPPWPAPWQTLYALERRELVVRSRRISRKGWPIDEWAITEAGREALSPRPRTRRASVDRLRIAGGSTRSMQAGEWVEVRIPEPERMPDPDPRWALVARERHLDAQDRREQARRIRRSARAA